MFYIIIILAAICTLPANADETLKYRSVYHITAAQTYDIGDVAGHTMTLLRELGIAFFPNGTTGSEVVVGVSDNTADRVSTFQGYTTLTFPDSSELLLKFTGSAKPDGARNPRGGTLTVIGGKGRFQGAKGEGTFEGDGARVGTELISYIDNAINVKK